MDPQISCVYAQCSRRAAAHIAPDTGTSARAHTPGSRERLPSRELPLPPAERSPVPPATGVEMAFDLENLPTVPTDSALFFSVPIRLSL
jgi:hypothetical protein